MLLLSPIMSPHLHNSYVHRIMEYVMSSLLLICYWKLEIKIRLGLGLSVHLYADNIDFFSQIFITMLLLILFITFCCLFRVCVSIMNVFQLSLYCSCSTLVLSLVPFFSSHCTIELNI